MQMLRCKSPVSLEDVSYVKCPLRPYRSHIRNRGARGYFFRKDVKKWQAQIGFNRTTVYLGLHDSEQAAHDAFLRAIETYGLRSREARENTHAEIPAVSKPSRMDEIHAMADRYHKNTEIYGYYRATDIFFEEYHILFPGATVLSPSETEACRAVGARASDNIKLYGPEVAANIALDELVSAGLID